MFSKCVFDFWDLKCWFWKTLKRANYFKVNLNQLLLKTHQIMEIIEISDILYSEFWNLVWILHQSLGGEKLAGKVATNSPIWEVSRAEMARGVNWLVGWLVGWLIGCLLACFFACLLACLLGWVVDWLVAWFVGWLRFCLFASLLALNTRNSTKRRLTASFGWVSGVQLTLAWLELAVLVLGLVACTTGYLACLFTCLVCWLVGWLVSWLVGR